MTVPVSIARLRLGALAALLLLMAACDGNGDGGEAALPAAERIRGTWMLTGASDSNGDQFATVQASFVSVRVTFRQDGTYVFDLDGRDDAQDLSLTGPYTVNETTAQLSLTVEAFGQSLPLALGFAFDDDDTLRLTSGAATTVLLNQLFQTGLDGAVTLTFTRE